MLSKITTYKLSPLDNLLHHYAICLTLHYYLSAVIASGVYICVCVCVQIFDAMSS